MRTFGPVVVAIPACNEADRIGPCLEALDVQTGPPADDIVLLLNNCTDATAAVARATKLHSRTQLHILEHNFSPAQANAGHARRLAMRHAAKLAGPDGVLLTTDADGLVDPDWIHANLNALTCGADVVAGWVELHPVEWGQIPAALHEDDARECAYDAACDEIHALLDPDPADPLPRHTQHSGASIAVTAEAYARSGGVPDIASGEDRAFVAALRRVDARLRHAPEVHVTVSGRIVGRSVGGMADTIRRRLSAPDDLLDDRLEPAVDCARRAWCRAALRRSFADPAHDFRPLVAQLQLGPAALRRLLTTPTFGAAWEAVEAAAPALRRRAVPVRQLTEHMAAAHAILAELRQWHSAGRSDRAALAAHRLEQAPWPQ